MDTQLSRPLQQFWAPLDAILDFAGGVALQVVSECPLRRYDKEDMLSLTKFYRI